MPSKEITMWVQRSLNQLGATPKLAEDGIYGPHTESMVRRFQMENKLTPDAIAGPNTIAEIKKHIDRL